VLNRATVRVADTRDVSGRVTAASVKRGFCAKKQSDLSRICALAIVGSVVSLAPISTHAAPGGVPAEIAELKAQVAALQSQVHALQSQLAAVQSNNALKLGPFVTVDPNPENGVRGPNIKFTGANIHILSGSRKTDDNFQTGGSLTGLGNLIIGYDEDPAAIGLSLHPGDRGGSHNLVIGRWNMFTNAAFGGLVAGEGNTISNGAASVLGGFQNTASGALASVLAGDFNTASELFASVSGGADNLANGFEASVSGGFGNTASGNGASVLGG
jgi:outer membrane murein-binding lipoprotein Lpp